MDVRLPIGAVVSLNSYQWDTYCWRSYDFTIYGDCNSEENFFVVREGLAGPGTISLESYTSPGYYWRHYDYKLRLDRDDGSDTFKKDGSFIPVAGFKDPSYVTLRSTNFPFKIVRHYDYSLRIDDWNDQASDFNNLIQDASWHVNIHDV